MLLHIIQEPLQRPKTPRTPEQAAVHADGHHFWRAFPLLVQHVKAVLQVRIKLLGGIKPLRGRKAHVVRIQRIRHDQVRLAGAVAAGHFRPEGQIVAVVVAVVVKTAVLHHQLARVGAVAPGVPAGWRLAEHVGQNVHRLVQVFALLADVHILIVDPAPAVADHVVIRRFDRLNNLRVTRQRHRHAKDRQRQAAFLKFIVDPPEPGAAAVFVEGVHRHVLVRVAGRADDVRQELLGPGIAVQNVVFRPLFVIEHKLHGDARLIRPPRVRRVARVAAQIPRIILFEKPHCHPQKLKWIQCLKMPA